MSTARNGLDLSHRGQRSASIHPQCRTDTPFPCTGGSKIHANHCHQPIFLRPPCDLDRTRYSEKGLPTRWTPERRCGERRRHRHERGAGREATECVQGATDCSRNHRRQSAPQGLRAVPKGSPRRQFQRGPRTPRPFDESWTRYGQRESAPSPEATRPPRPPGTCLPGSAPSSPL